MKIAAWTLFSWLGLFASLGAFGQTPPPNDDFSNRIVLTGTDVTFAGTLAGATVEDAEKLLAYQSYVTGATQSVWWTWMAPATTTLTVQIVSSSLDQFPEHTPAGIFLYCQTNESTRPDSLVAIPMGAAFANFRLAPLTASIPVTAGSNYVIQLLGRDSASYTFRLVATNTPLIVQQPRSQTVASNASALFYVVSAGTNQVELNFQWRQNGTNLDGETAPMLALTNIDPTMAGDYSVKVSNGAGQVVSEPATLCLSQSNVPARLLPIGLQSNGFQFSLAGEAGRNYRMESSTDLVNWSAETNFPQMPFWPDSTSIVYITNLPAALSVTNNGGREFLRATPYVPVGAGSEICINNLRQIRAAKLLWQRDYMEGQLQQRVALPFPTSPLSQPSSGDLLRYFPRHVGPTCPEDPFPLFEADYFLWGLLADPECAIRTHAHVLEDPQ
jgi:hypothetical protein